MRRLRYELNRLRELGPRERVREILHIKEVSWATQGELRERIERLEQAEPSAVAPPPVQAALAAARFPKRPENLALELAAVERWVAHLPPSELRVSVVMPTRERPDLLRRAVASVQAQTHPDWELLIVLDGDPDAATEAFVAELEDPRLRVIQGVKSQGGPPRNRALDEASGDAIAYLDDDNVMLPHWLAAVAWAFDTHPDADVLYGACVRDLGADLPEVQMFEWDSRLLAHYNLADQNVVAHRRGLPEAHFDESLRYAQDWERLGRLTADKDPLRLPVPAVLYTRDAAGRISDEPGAQDGYEVVRDRIRRSRGLRVLGYNWMFPLITETYIADELRSLVPHGAELAWFRGGPATSPVPVDEPIYSDIEEALAEFRPDLLFLHWLSYAVHELPQLERIGLPFAVRAHGFDVGPDGERLLAHPLCIGVWTYPSPGFEQMGDHTLVPIFTGVDRLPPPAAERNLILSVAAGLPKKDFPLVVDALARVEGAERRLALGITEGHEGMPAEVVALCQRYPSPPLVQLNLDRGQVHELQARAAAEVYTLRPDVNFGMPMSIIEGLCSGCAVIVPDRPECRAYAGPNARTYRTADDIVEHCHRVLAGGPEIEREREENMAYGRDRFCDPALGERFYQEVVDALARRAGVAEGNGHLPTAAQTVG